MNKVFITSTEDFQPVSLGDSYLYNNYSRINSFLRTRLQDGAKRLAKPVIAQGRVEWFSLYSGPMSSLEDYPDEYRARIEAEYVQLLKKVKTLGKQLKNSGDSDQIVWAGLIDAVFDHEDNIIISNGSEWCIIWGWKFRNKLHFTAPLFPDQEGFVEEVSDTKDQEENSEEKFQDVDSEEKEVINSDEKIQNDPIQDEEVEPEETLNEDENYISQNEGTVPIATSRLSAWQRFVRWLRIIMFRYWGLFLLIAIILLIICLCRSCAPCGSCENTAGDFEFNRIEQLLDKKCVENPDKG